MVLRSLICFLMVIPLQLFASQQPKLSQHAEPNSHGNYFLLAKKWDELSDQEKKRVKQAQDRYQKLPPDKKEKLREKWEKMPKKEKEKYRLEKKYR